MTIEVKFAERLGDGLGWLGGAATVYGPVGVVATAAMWGVISLARFAGTRLIETVAG